MANNRIQIRRSTANGTVSGLANGELAFTQVSNTLWIGLPDGSGSARIGGVDNPGVLTANQSLVANSTLGINRVLASNVDLQILGANSSPGSAGQILYSGGASANAYWAAAPGGGGGSVTQVNTGIGLTGGPVTTNGTISVLANNGLVANTTGVFVIGGDGLVSNATGVHIGSGNGISVSADAIAINSGSTLTVNSTGVHVNSALSITDLALSGNLTVSGTLTTVDATNLVVKDPIIKLANGNASTDTLDIGFYGVYGASGAKYTGLFRDVDDGLWKLFTGANSEPTTTVNTAAVGYLQGTLQAFLTSGAFVANSTQVIITANSTVSSTITANTLTLTTALAATSGGTGKGTMTSQAILVGNTTNGYNELALGASGLVLQSNGTALVYDTLDGGVF